MKEANVTLLIAEILAAILTVMIHCPLTGELGEIITCIARISNPLFFMIAGYYAYSSIEKSKIISIIWTCIKIHAVYALLAFFINYDCSLKAWFKWLLSRISLRNLFTTQMIGIWGADWFLISLILCHCCWYWLKRIKNIEKFLPLFLILLLIKIWLGEFYDNINIGIHRNFYFFGWPCYILGIEIKKYCKYILTPPPRKICVGILLGLGMSLFEHYKFNAKCDLYIGSIISSICIFILTLICEKRKLIKKQYMNLYTDLYYWHLLVLAILEKLVETKNKLWLNMKPLAVIGVTCIISILLSNIKFFNDNQKVKRRLENGL